MVLIHCHEWQWSNLNLLLQHISKSPIPISPYETFLLGCPTDISFVLSMFKTACISLCPNVRFIWTSLSPLGGHPSGVVTISWFSPLQLVLNNFWVYHLSLAFFRSLKKTFPDCLPGPRNVLLYQIHFLFIHRSSLTKTNHENPETIKTKTQLYNCKSSRCREEQFVNWESWNQWWNEAQKHVVTETLKQWKHSVCLFFIMFGYSIEVSPNDRDWLEVLPYAIFGKQFRFRFCFWFLRHIYRKWPKLSFLVLQGKLY